MYIKEINKENPELLKSLTNSEIANTSSLTASFSTYDLDIGVIYGKPITKRLIEEFKENHITPLIEGIVQNYGLDRQKFGIEDIYFSANPAEDTIFKLKVYGISVLKYNGVGFIDYTFQTVQKMPKLNPVFTNRFGIGIKTFQEYVNEVIKLLYKEMSNSNTISRRHYILGSNFTKGRKTLSRLTVLLRLSKKLTLTKEAKELNTILSKFKKNFAYQRLNNNTILSNSRLFANKIKPYIK